MRGANDQVRRASSSITQGDRESLKGLMTGLDYDQIYVDAWKSTIARCAKGLERDDLKDALEVKSPELFRSRLTQLLEKYNQSSDQAEVLFLIIPAIDHYELFANSFVALMRNTVDVSLMWGLLFLVIKLSLDSLGALDRINRMVKTIGIKLEYMNETMQSLKNTEQKKNVYVEVSKELVKLWLKIITAFRDSDLTGLKDTTWNIITSQFQTVLSQLEEAADRMTRILSLPLSKYHADDFHRLQALLQEEASGTTKTPGQELPHLLPSSKNIRFFGREEELAKIHSYIGPRPDQQSLLSTAIYGIGGVGKSQIALTYAHKHTLDYDAIFWVHAQTLVSLEQSFTEVVRLLGLGLADQDGQNRIVLLDWLQKTDKTWLLIFDNAEDPELIMQFWPVTDRGSVLITTRRHVLGMHPAATSVPINPFNKDEGAAFALHLLRASSPDSEEVGAAKKLSEILGGHALALTQASSLMLKKSWSIVKYLQMHARYPDKVRDAHSRELVHAGYTEGVETVFIMSFEHLSPDTSTVLGILSLLAPEGTPELIFTVEPTVDLPGHLQFCTDEFKVSDLIDELKKDGLVQRDSSTNKLSTHRLVQSEFSYYIRGKLQIAFHDACKLVYEAFPKQVHGRTFQPHFERCAMLIQHVYAVRDHLETGPQAGVPLQPSKEYCRLMCNAAYYLVEVGSTKELSKTVDSTMKGFKTTDLIHENPLAYAHICNSAALEREMSGDFSGAESLFKIAQEIRCRELPEGHEDIWAVMNNLGNLNLSLGNYAEALRFHLVCQQTIATSVKGNMMMNCINLGRCYTGLGRYTEAMGSFNRAKQYSPTAELSFRDYYYWVGNMYMSQGNLSEAKNMYRKGQESLKTEGHNISADMATCLYKLGVIALRDYYASNSDEMSKLAVQHFRESVTMMEFWKVADCEMARASYMLSVALFIQDNNDSEAAAWREKAERVRREIQGEKYFAEAHGEGIYDLIVESWVR